MLFRFSDVIESTGLPPATVASWIDRGIVGLDSRDHDEGRSGKPRGFCRARIYHFALMNALTKIGVNALRASDAASHFTDQSQPGRERGELFERGKTLLVISIDATKVINAETPFGANDGVSVVIDINKIVEKVDAALNACRRAA